MATALNPSSTPQLSPAHRMACDAPEDAETGDMLLYDAMEAT